MQSQTDIEENLKFINEDYEYERQAASVLNFFQRGLKKSEIKEVADCAVENVLINGNPLLIAEALVAMELFIKEVKDRKEFKDYVRDEASKTPKGFISASGAKIECAEVGTAYDFYKCEDPLWNNYNANLQHDKNLLKEREDILKTLPQSGLIFTDEETGESWKAFPPSKTSTSSYKVSLNSK